MKYNVTIKATVTKTIQVEADSRDAAIEQAHSEFTVAPDEDGNENYDEQTLSCTEAED